MSLLYSWEVIMYSWVHVKAAANMCEKRILTFDQADRFVMTTLKEVKVV